jgi:hypothetical protein
VVKKLCAVLIGLAVAARRNPCLLSMVGIHFVDAAFATGKTRSLYALDKPWDWGLAVEPDEKSVLFVEAEFEESNILVVKNFR